MTAHILFLSELDGLNTRRVVLTEEQARAAGLNFAPSVEAIRKIKELDEAAARAALEMRFVIVGRPAI